MIGDGLRDCFIEFTYQELLNYALDGGSYDLDKAKSSILTLAGEEKARYKVLLNNLNKVQEDAIRIKVNGEIQRSIDIIEKELVNIRARIGLDDKKDYLMRLNKTGKYSVR